MTIVYSGAISLSADESQTITRCRFGNDKVGNNVKLKTAQRIAV